MRLEWSRDALRVADLSPRALSRLRGAEGPGWDRWLRVYPAEIASARSDLWITGLPTMHGQWSVDGDGACFVPRFPFVAGTSYTVWFDPELDEPASEDRIGYDQSFDLERFSSLTITREHHEADRVARVVEIFPTAGEVPRNLLKVYVEFSHPMADGYAASNVRVQEAATGAPITGAFLPMEPELWDRERRRVTVLFDPARIKRGLAPHREAGYPLQEGTAVDVVVDDEFRDAAGGRLVAPFSQHFEVGPDVRAPVDPSNWALEIPAAGTVAPIVARFDRPLDAALLEHCLSVRDAHDRRVDGLVHLAVGEREWEFRPDTEWSATRYELAVDPMLEDLAGNSVTRVFDRDLDDPKHTPTTGGSVRLAFKPPRAPAT